MNHLWFNRGIYKKQQKMVTTLLQYFFLRDMYLCIIELSSFFVLFL